MICYTLLEDLRPAVDVVRKFAAGPKSLPVLRNVLLLAKDDALIVGASNLETFCWLSIPAAIGDFATTVEAKTLYGLLEKKGTGVVELEAGKDLRLDLAGRILTLPTIPAKDFPTLPESQPGTTIDAKAFVEAIEHVADFARPEERFSRPALTGIRWTDKGMIATDGARAAMAHLDELPTCTVPGLPKVAAAIAKSGAATLTVNYDAHRNQVLIECNQLHFAINCIDGKYPDVSQYIDYAAPTQAVVQTEDLLPALKSLHVIARQRDGEKKDAVGLHLNGSLDLTAEADGVGRSTFTMPYTKTGPDVDLAINGEWLRELVKGLHSDSVTLRLDSAHMPVLVSATDKPHLTAAIMPTKGA